MDSSIDNLKGEVEIFIKIFHEMKNVFLPTISFLTIGAPVFRWAKEFVTFVCDRCHTVVMDSVHKCFNVKTRFKADTCQLKR